MRTMQLGGLGAGAVIVGTLLLGSAPAGARVQTSALSPLAQQYLKPEWLTRIAGPVTPQLPPSADGPGAWAPWRANYYNEAPELARDWGLDAKQLTLFDRNLQSMVATLRQAPVLREAHSIRLWTTSGSLQANFSAVDGVPITRLPAMGTLMVGPWIAEWTKRDAKGQLRSAGETSHIMLNVNAIPTYSEASWMEDAEGAFFPLHRLPSPFPGTMLIGHNIEALLVLRPGRPDPYVPVSRERVLRAQIARLRDADRMVELSLTAAKAELARYLAPAQEAERQKRIAQEAEGFVRMNRMSEAAALERATARERGRQRALEEAANPPRSAPIYSMVRTREALQAQRDALSATERAAPAWVSAGTIWSGDPVSFLAPDAPGAVAIVRRNPAFYDRALPRTSIQLVVISKLGRYGDAAVATQARVNPPDLAGLLLVRQTDWAAFAAALP